MKKKLLQKSSSWHNVAEWPPSATTPWTQHNRSSLKLAKRSISIPHLSIFKKTLYNCFSYFNFLHFFQIFICKASPKQPTYPCKKNIFSLTTCITKQWFLFRTTVLTTKFNQKAVQNTIALDSTLKILWKCQFFFSGIKP